MFEKHFFNNAVLLLTGKTTISVATRPPLNNTVADQWNRWGRFSKLLACLRSQHLRWVKMRVLKTDTPVSKCTFFKRLVLGSRPPLRGVSRALRARNPRRVSERVSRGLPASGSKKCPKESQKSLRSLKAVFFETPETLPRLFRTLLDPGAAGPGRLFRRLFGDSGPEGPRRLL